MKEKNSSESTEETRRELEEEIDQYLNEKERIREILGRIGGVPRKKERIINVVFLILVALSFGMALIIQDPRNLPLETAILLVSVKLIYVVTQNARLNHSQFWMLSSIEWRLNEITKDIRKLKADSNT